MNFNSEIEVIQFHQFPEARVTVCCLTLTNGASIVGECHEYLGIDLGKSGAFKHALSKLENYHVKN